MASTSSSSNAELNEKINKAFNEAWDLINTRSGWNPAKTSFLRSLTAVDRIEWRRKRTGGSGSNRRSSGMVYRVTATLPGSKDNVAAILRDVNNMASWNRTLQVSISEYYGSKEKGRKAKPNQAIKPKRNEIRM